MQQLASPRRYAILGTGALGGFYGAHLQKAGLEVHFLLRSDYQQVKHSGLHIASPQGNFTLPQVWAYEDVAQMPPCDVVILALKTTQNHLLPHLLPGVIQPEGVVLVLQNGLGVEATVAQIVGAERVMGGLCFLAANKVGPGQICHLDYGEILLAEYTATNEPAGVSDRMHQIAQDFRQAGIAIEFAEDLLLARWQKLVWNIPFNGLSVVLNTSVDAIVACPQSFQLAQALMQEVVDSAAGLGRHIPAAFVQKMLDYTVKMPPYRTSMKIDYELGRPMEVETMVGQPVRTAQAAGATVPRMAMLYQQLKFLDQRHQH